MAEAKGPPILVVGKPGELPPADKLPQAVREAVEGNKVQYVSLAQVQQQDLKPPFLVLSETDLGLYPTPARGDNYGRGGV